VAIDPDQLADLLAGRLAAIVPAGIQVRAAAGMLWYSRHAGRFPGQLGDFGPGMSGTHVRDNFEVYGPADEDRLAGTAVQALDELQDFVSEATHDPWPGERTQPRAQAQVRGPVLHLWYGAAAGDHVVLACEPIPLASLRRG
jgi:hypothetical protein